MDDLDALLADLQNTVPGQVQSSAPGYGSLNGARGPPTLSPQSPTYQNQRVVQETVTRSYSSQAPLTSTPNSNVTPQGTLKGASHSHTSPASNNLSELDTLLQDLSNAHYATVYNEKRVNGTTSPVYATPNGTPGGVRGSLERPSVDSLLEELNAVSPTPTNQPNHYINGDSLPRPGRQVTITVRETTAVPTANQTYTTYGQGSPGYQQGGYTSQENTVHSTSQYQVRGAPSPQNYQTQQPGGYGGYQSNETTVHSTQYQNQHTQPPPATVAASSATKELDDLMASLSDFKINASSHQIQTVTDSPYAKPNKATHSSETHVTQTTSQTFNHISQPTQIRSGDQLDSMLGNLQADMSRQGINTTQKGCCNACDKPIVGQVITALGKTWHPEHFTCTHCSSELGTRNFFERDGHPYCEPDYHNLFSPRCAYCNGPILDKCVTALEKTWHTEHFFCAQCGQQFGEDGFHERDGKPYCRNDYFDMFAPKCGGCNRPIMENYISALNGQWHPACFVCRDCRSPFHAGSFFDHEGLPYCETHYHAKRGSLCAGCHKPIAGRCITAMFRKFHPEHFVCAFCLKQLNKGTFKEQNDKPYCHTCFDKLFG